MSRLQHKNAGIFGCRSIPLAVGYSPSQVNSSDFSNYSGVHSSRASERLSCRASPTGTAGTQLRYERREHAVLVPDLFRKQGATL